MIVTPIASLISTKCYPNASTSRDYLLDYVEKGLNTESPWTTMHSPSLGQMSFVMVCPPSLTTDDAHMQQEFGDRQSTVFWRFKKVLISIVWGCMFPTYFCQFFKKIIIKDKRDFSLKDLVVSGVIMKKFLEGRQYFTLSEVFEVELSNGEKMEVLFDEEIVIKGVGVHNFQCEYKSQ